MKKKSLIITALIIISSAFGASDQIIQVSTSAVNMVPGETGYITITLRNDGLTPAYDLKAVLTSLENPLTAPDLCYLCDLYSSARMMCLEYDETCYNDLGDLYGSDTKDFTFGIDIPEDTPNGYYLAELWFSYLDGPTSSAETRRLTKQVLFLITNEQVRPRIIIERASTEPGLVKPGSVFDLNLKLTNTGFSSAKSITLTLEGLGLTPINQSNQVFISEINGSSSRDVMIKLSADKSLTTGALPVSLLINYTDGLNDYFSAENFGIIIGGNASFNVFVQDVSFSAVSGLHNVLISIANNGLVPAESVNIKLNPSSEIELKSVNEEFIGDLNPGDFTTAGFSIKPLEELIDLVFTIQYTDALGNVVEFNEAETITITETTTTAQPVTGNYLLIIALLVIGSLAVYFFLKSKRK